MHTHPHLPTTEHLMFAAVSKLTQAAHKAHRKLDTISHQLIQCVDRDLQEVSDELETSVENLVELQKECQKEDVKNQEEVFLAAINANQELSDILNKSLQRAALSTRGAEYLTDSMERATIIFGITSSSLRWMPGYGKTASGDLLFLRFQDNNMVISSLLSILGK